MDGARRHPPTNTEKKAITAPDVCVPMMVAIIARIRTGEYRLKRSTAWNHREHTPHACVAVSHRISVSPALSSVLALPTSAWCLAKIGSFRPPPKSKVLPFWLHKVWG
jgi:hypothetical protein